jgi:DNA repair protein RadA/Sms
MPLLIVTRILASPSALSTITSLETLKQIMSKVKTRYVCNNCGATSSNWLGKCPQCNQWDTFTEEIIQSASPQITQVAEKEKSIPTLLAEINIESEMRVSLGDPELERVLGGGIVPGSVILMAGEPGAGKSTLCLQLAANPALRMLYISGEESISQIKMRAQRLGIKGDNCHILTETDLNKIIEAIIDIQSGIVIIDSVQTLYTPELESVPGSVSQIRECSYRLQQLAKQTAITIIMVGHITKEGDIAGPN